MNHNLLGKLSLSADEKTMLSLISTNEPAKQLEGNKTKSFDITQFLDYVRQESEASPVFIRKSSLNYAKNLLEISYSGANDMDFNLLLYALQTPVPNKNAMEKISRYCREYDKKWYLVLFPVEHEHIYYMIGDSVGGYDIEGTLLYEKECVAKTNHYSFGNEEFQKFQKEEIGGLKDKEAVFGKLLEMIHRDAFK